MESITRILCDQARAGSREAYDRLFALHADRALLFIRARLGRKLRESVESQDVLQDADLAAHQAFSQFEYTDDGEFTRWLCRIIEHRLCDLGDRFGALKRQAVKLPRSNPSGPVTAADRAEHREKIAQALDTLDNDHRQVLLLRFFKGLSAEETGERMHRTAGTVRKLAARALTELGRKLQIRRTPEVCGYRVALWRTEVRGGGTYFKESHTETTRGPVLPLADIPDEAAESLGLRRPGSTGTWSVEAFDGEGRWIARTRAQRAFVVSNHHLDY